MGSSDSDSSSCDEYIRHTNNFSSAERFQRSSYLSDFTDDEDAIHINVMRDFARMENAKVNLKHNEFSASACQKIHSELLASVNQIYKNLKTKPLMRKGSHPTSSLSNSTKQSISKLTKSKSIDHKVTMNNTYPRKKANSESDTKLPKHLKRRIEKNLEEEKKKQKNAVNENSKNDQVTDKMAVLNLMKPRKSKPK